MPRTKLGTPKGPFTCYPSFVYVYWDREGPLSYMWRAPPEELRGPAASTALAKLRRDANWVHFYVSHTWEEAGWPKWLSLCTIMNGACQFARRTPHSYANSRPLRPHHRAGRVLLLGVPAVCVPQGDGPGAFYPITS